ncbi:MAG TPA: HupE/UreJ family protein [Vicinamibacteria bacterium]|nr:HupE/UreJ family protein [Vicinamibacteria bacterium]
MTALLAAAQLAEGHPVAQGRMAVEILQDRLLVRATVPLEEVLVASAQASPDEAALPLRLRTHGDYLASHLHVVADGCALTGRVLEGPERYTGGWPSYLLEYGPTRAQPTHIELQQNVLREFQFAPGNPWEASYIVSIGRAGERPEQGSLLTSRGPLNWQDSSHATEVGLLAAFVRHGMTHILAGYDHLLFVAALVLAVASLWDLVKVVAAFTLAHTLTLALAAFGLLRLPGAFVEPMIAASIVCVALQNVLWPERSRGRSRLVVAFLFGLFHGLGFAGGLLEAMAGLPTVSALLAIAAFSAGVEIGHQAVVLPAFAGLRLLRRTGLSNGPDAVLSRYGSVLIAVAGSVYLAAALR